MMVTRLMKADTVEFRLSDIVTRRATSNFVLRAQAQTKTRIYCKSQKIRAFKNLAPTALPIPHKNHKDAGMDLEIFRSQFFDLFPQYPTFSVIRPPIDPFKSNYRDSSVFYVYT